LRIPCDKPAEKVEPFPYPGDEPISEEPLGEVHVSFTDGSRDGFHVALHRERARLQDILEFVSGFALFDWAIRHWPTPDEPVDLPVDPSISVVYVKPGDALIAIHKE
jgi:hypothetical protein